MGGGGRGDEEAIRAYNAQAPAIPHLWRRVVAMFRPYRQGLVVTAVLVVVGAAAAVAPPLVLRRIFDDALAARRQAVSR